MAIFRLSLNDDDPSPFSSITFFSHVKRCFCHIFRYPLPLTVDVANGRPQMTSRTEEKYI